MEITFTLNGKKVTPQIDADTLLIDLVRDLGCYSVKRGCETSNCGLCTVFMDDQPILSCSILAARVDGPVSYTHLRAHETDSYLVCRLLLEKKKTKHT